jgi:hypothetical protein
MKNRTGDIRFMLMTGVSKFTMEAVSSIGRADIIARHPAMVCIFELKVDEPVDAAFKQIREKGYAEPPRLTADESFRPNRVESAVAIGLN